MPLSWNVDEQQGALEFIQNDAKMHVFQGAFLKYWFWVALHVLLCLGSCTNKHLRAKQCQHTSRNIHGIFHCIDPRSCVSPCPFFAMADDRISDYHVDVIVAV
jgi:hypothetical protein